MGVRPLPQWLLLPRPVETIPNMDTNSYLIIALSVLVLLNMLFRSAAGATSPHLARIERKLDLLLAKFEINPVPDAAEEIVALVRSGNKIEAIRRYRAATGVGLKEAKDYVDQL